MFHHGPIRGQGSWGIYSLSPICHQLRAAPREAGKAWDVCRTLVSGQPNSDVIIGLEGSGWPAKACLSRVKATWCKQRKLGTGYVPSLIWWWKSLSDFSRFFYVQRLFLFAQLANSYLSLKTLLGCPLVVDSGNCCFCQSFLHRDGQSEFSVPLTVVIG